MLDNAAVNSSKDTHALGEQAKVGSLFVAASADCKVAFF